MRFSFIQTLWFKFVLIFRFRPLSNMARLLPNIFSLWVVVSFFCFMLNRGKEVMLFITHQYRNVCEAFSKKSRTHSRHKLNASRFMTRERCLFDCNIGYINHTRWFALYRFSITFGKVEKFVNKNQLTCHFCPFPTDLW